MSEQDPAIVLLEAEVAALEAVPEGETVEERDLRLPRLESLKSAVTRLRVPVPDPELVVAQVQLGFMTAQFDGMTARLAGAHVSHGLLPIAAIGGFCEREVLSVQRQLALLAERHGAGV